MRTLVLVPLLLSLAGCAVQPRPEALGPGCAERELVRMYFGAESPDGPIDEAAWSNFLAAEVTPRFPDGLTVYSTQGQWRGADGVVQREPSRVVEIVLTRPSRADLEAIVAAYRTRFRQESVLVVRDRAVACF
jgi:hypothetical protein